MSLNENKRRTHVEDNSFAFTSHSQVDIPVAIANNKENYNTNIITSKTLNATKHILLTPYFGICYAILSSVFITLSSVILKKVIHFNGGQQNLVSSVWLVVGSIPVAVYVRKRVFGPVRHRFLTFLRAILGAATVYLTIVAYRYLPVAEVAIIFSTTPGASAIVARIFLKQPCGLVQSVSVVLTVIGALLTVRVPELLKNREDVIFTSEYITGLACAVAYVICAAFAYLLVRITNDVHVSIQLIHLGLVGSVAGACAATTLNVQLPHCGSDRVLMLASGLVYFLGCCFITVAMQTEAVGIVTVMRSSTDVVAALIFQMIFFQLYPDSYNLYAAALVIFSAGLLGLRKWLQQLPEESIIKNQLKLISR